ncbi:MAG TPA: DUF4157 domain-containing protein [Ktedonobacteraceae bacterium]|nr:DUF4157 domain-containing protein [Ktedonobacteraceae bacterium]
MDSFKQLQRKSNVGSAPTASSVSHLRSSRQLASVSTPGLMQAHSDTQARLKYSLANIGLFDQTHLPEQPEKRMRIVKGRGRPLDRNFLHGLEQELGTQLSHVRVHTDAEADNLARSVNAEAFTTGTDIFFREGMYQPATPNGLHTLAHEVTHVVQQARGPVEGKPVADGVSISDPNDQFEQEAQASANRISMQKLVPQAIAGGFGPATRSQHSHLVTTNQPLSFKRYNAQAMQGQPSSASAHEVHRPVPIQRVLWTTKARRNRISSVQEFMTKFDQKELPERTKKLIQKQIDSKDNYYAGDLNLQIGLKKLGGPVTEEETQRVGYGVLANLPREKRTARVTPTKEETSLPQINPVEEIDPEANIYKPIQTPQLLNDFGVHFPDAANLLYGNQPAYDLLRETETVGATFGGPSEQSPTKDTRAYTTSNNEVFIPQSEKDPVKNLGDFLFELNNARNRPDFAQIEQEASQGTLNEDDYVQRVADVETDAVLRSGEIYSQVKTSNNLPSTYDNEFYLSDYETVNQSGDPVAARKQLAQELLKRPYPPNYPHKTPEDRYRDQYRRNFSGNVQP